MEQIMNFLLNEVIDILGYIDDLGLWNQDPDELEIQIWRTIVLLEVLGLTVNGEKSSLSPTSSLTWVGVV